MDLLAPGVIESVAKSPDRLEKRLKAVSEHLAALDQPDEDDSALLRQLQPVARELLPCVKHSKEVSV